MERAIHRGQLLREILKQERLAPLPATFQLAWLIAFNEGLFDAHDPEQIVGVMERLAELVTGSNLALESPREDWAVALAGWLGDSEGEHE